ncbi:MAG: TonB-dependent receptor, partial [Flavobacteriales bacterium]|nr:TonB-dependent receptor [Flavobacteriales bacterium]
SPVNIEIINPKLFQRNPSPNIFESLSMVNGVRPQMQCNVCNTGDIHINGMEGPYTMFMIDGMPIVSALSTVYGLMGIPNSMIQRVEIQKGPASTLYGSEAVGGLINIITKSAYGKPGLTLDVMGTSYNEFNTDLGVRFKVGKNVSSLLSLNYFNFNKQHDINKDNFTDIPLQNRISVFNKWSFNRNKNRMANIGFRYMYEDRNGGDMRWEPKFRGGDSIYGESIYTSRIELIGNYELPVNEKIILYYSFNAHDQNSAYGNTYYIANQKIAFGQLVWDRPINKNNSLVVGSALRYTYYDDNTLITMSDDTINQKNIPSNVFLPGIFMQNETVLNSNHTLLTGIRYDYNTNHGNIFSPRLNYKYSPNAKNVFRLSIGNGYRVVNLFSEEHAAFNGARKIEVVNKLKPEQSWNVGLNYNRVISTENICGSIDANLFYTYFDNKIIADYFTDPNKVIFDNLNGYAINRGFGVNSDFTFNNNFKLSAGFTFMDVFQMDIDSNSNYVRSEQVHTPPFTGNYVIGYTIQKWKTSIDLSGIVTSPMLLPVLPNDYRPDHSPWYHIVNIQITKKLPRNIELYGGLKNLLNFIPENPLMRPFDPFDKNTDDPVNNPYGYTFDAGYNYAPMQSIRGFFGVR